MEDGSAKLSDARLALDRAHDAARSANGAILRRSINEAVDCLKGGSPEAVSLLRTALDDLDSGALVDMERLLEEARRTLTARAAQA